MQKLANTVVSTLYIIWVTHAEPSYQNRDKKPTQILTYFRDGVLGQEVPRNAGQCSLIFKTLCGSMPSDLPRWRRPAAAHCVSLGLG